MLALQRSGHVQLERNKKLSEPELKLALVRRKLDPLENKLACVPQECEHVTKLRKRNFKTTKETRAASYFPGNLEFILSMTSRSLPTTNIWKHELETTLNIGVFVINNLLHSFTLYF